MHNSENLEPVTVFGDADSKITLENMGKASVSMMIFSSP